MATIKATLQNIAGAIGITQPDSFVGNTDATARRLLRQADLAGRYLARRDWQALTFEHTITTSSGTLEYALPTSPAFHHFKPQTAFDRTNYRRMVGQLTPEVWQWGEAVLTVAGGLEQRWRIKVDTSAPRTAKFYLLDDPAATLTLAFEYVTDEWVYDGSSAYKTAISADADEPVFDSYLFELETTWRVLRAIGEPFFDEKDEAMRAADRLFAQENPTPIQMNRPSVRGAEANIPEGSWS